MNKRSIELSGVWNAKIIERGLEFPMNIPGDSISALLDAQLIEDPYIGTHELDIQWINTSRLVIEKSFEVSEPILSAQRIELVLPQIDTFSQVYLNDTLIGKSCSQFIDYRFDISEVLISGVNGLRVEFDSAEEEALRRNETLPYSIPHQIYPIQSMHRNLVRKVQCHSGWDWGPCLMVSGLYETPVIEAWDSVQLRSVKVDTLKDENGTWELSFRIKTAISDDLKIPNEKIHIQVPELDLSSTIELSQVFSLRDITREDDQAYLEAAISFTDLTPELWWPAGYGEQPLYEASVTIGNDDRTVRFGFRTISLDFSDDEAGRAMTVLVNDKRIFCKGADWIPIDALPSKQTDQRYIQLLEDSVAVGMNMIRIWGGGQYEKDIFYSTCDELGILLWHDCMFSCSLYPSTDSFLAEVREEMRSQIDRLQYHPSIALWCGNNEDVGALTWYEESRENRDRYIIDYDRLNEGVIGNMVRELDPHRPWWPSSPSGGPGDYSDCWHNDAKGDMHYWSVWHEGKPFEAYRDVTPRFCSEFGFQSFSSYQEMSEVIDRDQMQPTSEQMLHHQKNPRGNSIITQTMQRYFSVPKGDAELLYLSQVQQAYGIQIAVDYWRSKRDTCMGILYWQLNDLWPVASWSSIEYSGRWKVLHNSAKRFFAPIHITCIPEDDRLNIYGINDSFNDLDLRSSIQLISSDSGKILEETNRDVVLKAESSLLLEHRAREDSSTLYRVQILSSDTVIAENWHFNRLPNETELKEPKITLSYDKEEDLWTVESDRPAYYVWLSCKAPGYFSDNGFNLLPGERKEVTFFSSRGSMFHADTPSTTEEITIFDLYHAMFS